ncbi:MAG: RDD family protein [Thermomicrobiales bacterium]|nr:RDD family protein [Thermomicrobiales bacterium]
MYCTQCGAVLSQGAIFCGNCGWQVASGQAWRDEVSQREARGLKLCVKCRSEIPLDATVCHRCDAAQPSYSPNLWAPTVAPPAAAPPRLPDRYPSAAAPAPGAVPPVSFELEAKPQELASVGRRIAAYAIDIVVLVLIAVIVVLAAGIDPEEADSQNQQIAIYAIITLVYFTVAEALTGQTVGKRLTGIRVTTLTGEPIGWGKSAGRNLLRIVDSLPALYIVGIVVMSRSDRLQRVGDKAAGTIVVVDKGNRN